MSMSCTGVSGVAHRDTSVLARCDFPQAMPPVTPITTCSLRRRSSTSLTISGTYSWVKPWYRQSDSLTALELTMREFATPEESTWVCDPALLGEVDLVHHPLVVVVLDPADALDHHGEAGLVGVVGEELVLDGVDLDAEVG